MPKRLLMILASMVLAWRISASGQTPLYPEFDAARDKYQQTLQAIWKDRETQLAPVLKLYGERLAQLQKKFTDMADPKGADAVADEQQRFFKGLEPTDEERRAMPAALKTLRTSFESERAAAAQRSMAAETQTQAAWVDALRKMHRQQTDPFETNMKAPARAALVRAELERATALQKEPIRFTPPTIVPSALPPPTAGGEKPVVADSATARQTALAAVRRLKLSGFEKAREGEDVLAGAVSVESGLLKDAGSVELLSVHDAAEKPMNHNGGSAQRVSGGWSKVAMAGKVGGIFLWGPYEVLEAGKYIVVYRLRLMKEAGEKNLCFVDVAHKGVTVHGIRPNAEAMPVGQWAELGVSLNLASKQDLEYRLWGNGHEIAIDRIYVYRLSAP